MTEELKSIQRKLTLFKKFYLYVVSLLESLVENNLLCKVEITVGIKFKKLLSCYSFSKIKDKKQLNCIDENAWWTKNIMCTIAHYILLDMWLLFYYYA